MHSGSVRVSLSPSGVPRGLWLLFVQERACDLGPRTPKYTRVLKSVCRFCVSERRPLASLTTHDGGRDLAPFIFKNQFK